MSREPRPPAGAPQPVQLLKPSGGFGKPSVWIVDAAGRPRVWKTWDDRPSWERATLGRRMAQREGRVLQRLAGILGAPAFLGHPHPWTLEMQLLRAEPVPEEKHGTALSALYFERLEAALAEMHRRGVNHGDLRRKNLLRDPDDPDMPLLIDFTQSLLVKMPPRFPASWFLAEAVRIDRVTLLKLKRWYLGDQALSNDERAELECVPWHLSVGRLLRHHLYRPVRRGLQGKRPWR